MNKLMVIQLLENIVREREELIKELTDKRMRNGMKAIAASKYRLEQLALSEAIATLKHKDA